MSSLTAARATTTTSPSTHLQSQLLLREQRPSSYLLLSTTQKTRQPSSSTTLNNYNCWKSKVNSTASRPVIAFVNYYDGEWSIPQSGFKPGLVADAGGQLAGLSTTYTDLPSLVADLNARGVDIVIDESYFLDGLPSLDMVLANYGLNSSNYTSQRWGKNIYRVDGQITSSYSFDWFDGGQVFADAVLNDFMNIINSSLPTPSYKRVWIRSIYNETPKVYNPNDCKDYSQPTLSPSPTCTVQTSSAVSLMHVGVIHVAALLLAVVSLI